LKGRFAFCGNSITEAQSFADADRKIREKTMSMYATVEIEHDAIRYKWESVPEEKRRNWLEMSASDLTAPDYSARGFPFMLQVEPTSICNLKCPLCPTGRGVLNRELRHMELEELQALVDDMERYLLFLVLWDWGVSGESLGAGV
jgi:hypothetical protein